MLCGIFFITSYHTKVDKKKFEDSLESLNHRGPNETGILYTNIYSFGHKRLSIRDIENGKQPMSILNHHLIYNGEIYNTNYLRDKLSSKGISLENNSDALLMLKLLMEFGIEIINEINGIFAFVYTDNDKVYIVRDKYGIKPLYYSYVDDEIIASSEIKAILKYKGEAIVDKEGLCELLGMGPSHSQGKTVYKGIYELKPGHYILMQDGNISTKQYYTLKPYVNTLNYKETVKKAYELVTKAIESQMVSDVGVSTFLSGGLDSSIVSTVASRFNKEFNAYNIDYEKNDFMPNEFETSQDLDYARLVAKQIGVRLHEVIVDNKSLIENLKLAVIAKDGPGMTDIDSSLLYLAKYISKYNSMVLSGECSDEVFGGYRWYYEKQKEIKTFPWIRNIEFRQNLLNKNLDINLSEYVTNEFEKAVNEVPLNKEDSEITKKERTMFYLNLKYFMTNLLDRNDRMVMQYSIESRVPFCDSDLVEFLYNVPFKYKYRAKVEKKLLRDAFKGEVIPEVIKRKKSPYPKSNSKEYDEMVKELVVKILEDKNSIIHKIFDIEQVKKLIDSDEFDIPWYGQLMRKTSMLAYIYQIDYWAKEYNIKLEL